MSGNETGQLRLSLEQVIQMMQTQCPAEVVIQDKESWPPVAWVLLQTDADGADRNVTASQLGVEVSDLAELIESLIQAPDSKTAQQVWQVGVICLKTAKMQTNQVLATTWDQVEALAVSKLAEAIQHVSGKTVDPMKLASIAKTANSAIRRQAGEGSGRAGPGGGLDIEMQSGELGSIRLRLSPRVIEQMSNPSKVIDSIAKDVTQPRSHEMLRLKDIRPIAEEMDSAADKEAILAASNQALESQRAQRAKIDDKQFGDFAKLTEMMGVKNG